MVKVYYYSDGTIARILWTPEEQAQYPDAPAGTSLYQFDETTNPTLGDNQIADSLRGAQHLYKVLNGVLHKRDASFNYVPYPINTPSQEYLDDQQAETIWSNLAADQSPSAAQAKVLFRWLVRSERRRRQTGTLALKG
jgi:hypothetical protein